MMTENQPKADALSIIEGVEVSEIQGTMQKITQFQKVVQNQLRQNHDFGIIPGTGKKPTLLKPGAEKLLMLLGLRSEFDIAESSRDWDKGFFQYQIKCSLYKQDVLITEGMGAANSRETRYRKQDPFSIDNTILKMAKKRALVDAALLVGSLSDIFSQDLEDLDLAGEKPGNGNGNGKRQYTDQDGTISKAQAKRMFAIAQGDGDLVKAVIGKKGYEKTSEIKKVEYDALCDELEKAMAKQEEEDAEILDDL